MNKELISELQQSSSALLKELVSIPSFSREESGTADAIENFLRKNGVEPQRYFNNVWAKNLHFDPSKPTLLLNSHHDTVKPNLGYTHYPYSPTEIDGKIFGLGSNDAGASLVSLLAAFLYFQKEPSLNYNLVFAASAEEEISGMNGMEALIPQLPPINCAIVGEPTGMQLAVAEKGLVVIDCIIRGRSGHAAREEGENAIYKAIENINRIRSLQFDRKSELTGEVKATVTVMDTDNGAHNVVPDSCRFTIDVRVNELYSLEEIFEIIRNAIEGEVKARSFRLRSTRIEMDHPLVNAGRELGKNTYGSPTLSDKALMSFPSLKMGPGDSARSHAADEFIYKDELFSGIEDYVALLKKLL